MDGVGGAYKVCFCDAETLAAGQQSCGADPSAYAVEVRAANVGVSCPRGAGRGGLGVGRWARGTPRGEGARAPETPSLELGIAACGGGLQVPSGRELVRACRDRSGSRCVRQSAGRRRSWVDRHRGGQLAVRSPAAWTTSGCLAPVRMGVRGGPGAFQRFVPLVGGRRVTGRTWLVCAAVPWRVAMLPHRGGCGDGEPAALQAGDLSAARGAVGPCGWCGWRGRLAALQDDRRHGRLVALSAAGNGCQSTPMLVVGTRQRVGAGHVACMCCKRSELAVGPWRYGPASAGKAGIALGVRRGAVRMRVIRLFLPLAVVWSLVFCPAALSDPHSLICSLVW